MTNINNSTIILDRLTAINLDVVIWSARKKLTTADFGGVELPPEELASLGSKKICDPENLRIFSTLKARAIGHLDKIGVRFLGGWAIPENETEFLNARLMNIKQEFLTAKDDFLNNYDQAVKSWVDKHPGWEQLIAVSTVGAEHVRRRLDFNWQFFKVVSPSTSDTAQNLNNEVETLGQTLFGEIAKEAQNIWKKIYAGKTEVSHRALSPLQAMKDKLIGLSFVESRVAPVADLINTAIESIPKRGFISGVPLVTLQGLISMLRDPDLLLEHGQKVIDGYSPTEILKSLKTDLESDQTPDFYDLADLESLESLEDLEDENNLDANNIKNKRPFLDSLGLW